MSQSTVRRRPCITHHHACDCREEHFRQIEIEIERLRAALREVVNATDAGATEPQRHADSEWAICPWCGYKHGDGWEWAQSRTETRCDECDNVFTVDPEFSVIYHTFITGHEKP